MAATAAVDVAAAAAGDAAIVASLSRMECVRECVALPLPSPPPMLSAVMSACCCSSLALPSPLPLLLRLLPVLDRIQALSVASSSLDSIAVATAASLRGEGAAILQQLVSIDPAIVDSRGGGGRAGSESEAVRMSHDDRQPRYAQGDTRSDSSSE